MPECLKKLVTQSLEETGHELYDRVRQEYMALGEHLRHTEAAVNRSVERPCGVESCVNEMDPSRGQDGDAK